MLNAETLLFGAFPKTRELISRLKREGVAYRRVHGMITFTLQEEEGDCAVLFCRKAHFRGVSLRYFCAGKEDETAKTLRARIEAACGSPFLDNTNHRERKTSTIWAPGVAYYSLPEEERRAFRGETLELSRDREAHGGEAFVEVLRLLPAARAPQGGQTSVRHPLVLIFGCGIPLGFGLGVILGAIIGFTWQTFAIAYAITIGIYGGMIGIAVLCARAEAARQKKRTHRDAARLAAFDRERQRLAPGTPHTAAVFVQTVGERGTIVSSTAKQALVSAEEEGFCVQWKKGKTPMLQRFRYADVAEYRVGENLFAVRMADGASYALIDVADRGFLHAIHRGMGYTGERYDAIERSVRERLTEYDPNSVLACGAREDELEIDIRYLSKMLYDGTDLSASRILALLREFYAESGVTDWEPLAGVIAADLGTAPLSDNGTPMSANTLDFTDLFA